MKRWAFDFDDTLTARPEELGMLINALKYRGDDCICVTARRSTEENADFVDNFLAEHGIMMRVFLTNLGSKIEYMKSVGVHVDIWVDDHPESLVNGR
jgi:hypothetical protein